MDKMKLPEIEAEKLKQLLQKDFEQCVVEVVEAIDAAKAGSIIDHSEEPVRMATAKLRQKIFEKALQMKTDAAQAAFPPRHRAKTKSKWRHKGKQSVEHSTVNGVVNLKRIYWWSRQHGRDDTIDQLIGIVASKVSVGVRQMCCRVVVSQQGFARAAEHLKQLAQVSISRERLRQIVESEGQLVLDVQRKGLLPASLRVEDCKTSPQGPKRLYLGTDGVKVPMVTQQEKDKRRKNRRRKRPGSKHRRMHKGSDNAYKEFKIATIYDESNEHRQVFATSGNHEILGRLVRREAKRLKIAAADEKVAVVDGADWIRKQLDSKLPLLDGRILDFYHLSEHIWSVSNSCFDQGSERAKAFASELLHIAKHQGPTVLLTRLMDERKKYRSKSKRKALKELIQYIARRFEMCDYLKFLANGWQIGSGPTEAMCKVLTYRLKGAGMRWDRPGVDSIMALVALEQSNTWKSYWDIQKQAA